MILINAKISVRIKAFLWDILFCSIYMILAIFLSAIISEITLELFDFSLLDLPFFIEIIYYSMHVYFFFSDFLTRKGSIGKKIMKLKIVNEDGSKPRKRSFLLRGIGNMLMIIDLIPCGNNIERRSISDRVSKTRVVYENDEIQLKHEGKIWHD